MEMQGIFNPGQQTDLREIQIVHETSKPLGFLTVFTSAGDDLNNHKRFGGGTPLKVSHSIGEERTKLVTVDFNCKGNRTYIHEGYIIWRNADFDKLTVDIVPLTTLYSSGVNTNFNIVNGVIIPAAGDGLVSVNLEDIKLVEMTIQEATKQRATAYWNADYDYETNTYSNLTPAPNGDGLYNIFGEEVVFYRMLNKAIFLKDGFIKLQTADAAEIGQGYRIKMIIETEGEDHSWDAACIMVLHREKTY